MKFSIIIPCYKVEQYLHQCVDSVLAQTYEDYEVILVVPIIVLPYAMSMARKQTK